MKRIEIDEYKQVVLSILERIDMVCKENGLKYFLFAGTLLGAVRHKGFIPWDDDIDICMMREDYDKLASIMKQTDYGLRFIRIEENTDTIYPYGKICDTKTAMIEHNFKQVNGYGAFIDVFPFDYLPDSAEERKKLKRKYFKMYQLLTHSSRISYVKTESIFLNVKRQLALMLGQFFKTEKLVRKMNKEFKEFNKEKTNTVGLAWALGWPAEEFAETSEVIFEGLTFCGPKNPDKVLTIHFGDYMKLPPESERVNKHNLECYYID